MIKRHHELMLPFLSLWALFLLLPIPVQADEATHQQRGTSIRPAQEEPQTQSGNQSNLALPQELVDLIGLAEGEAEKWGSAIEALHSGENSEDPEQSSELFQRLSSLSDIQIDTLLSGDADISPGLRKTLEAVKHFGAKGLKELEELGTEKTSLLGQVARSVLERKKADIEFLRRARMIRQGLNGLDTKLGQQKPSRSDIGEIADARISLRASIDQLLAQGGRHPQSKEAIQAYRDALETEKGILERHRRLAIDRSQPSYWGILGSELKRNYLSLDGAHRALGAVGMIPLLGEAADLIDGTLYLAEGKKLDASLSFAAMIPVAGIGVTAGRQTVKAVGAVAEAGYTAVDLGRAARSAARGAEAVGDVGDAARRSARSSSDFSSRPASEVGRELEKRAWTPSVGDAAEKVRPDDAPLYQVNGKHVRGTPAYREARSASVLPDNHVELYRGAVRADNGDYWAIDSVGNYHRFEQANGRVHWSGSTLLKKPKKPGSKPPTRDNPDPIDFKHVPKEVVKLLG